VLEQPREKCGSTRPQTLNLKLFLINALYPLTMYHTSNRFLTMLEVRL
jgi:hypothetical protein